ncbi:MAG: hypothetical protein RL662_579 [Bacteroidota bacterium]|jgi:O-antigen/teichoic acid export membrane protein
MDRIRNQVRKIGIDKAIAYSSLARIIQAGGGVFTIFFIASCLTFDEQGYYYTFGSILAIQVFFELGLGSIITQYVAYEVAHMRLEGHSFVGSDQYKSRLTSLLRLFVKWYFIISILFLFVLIAVGFAFFSKFGGIGTVEWKAPWIILSVSSAFNLFLSPFIAFIEGLGKVKEVAFLRMLTQIVAILLVWFVLLMGGKLYASAFAFFAYSVISSTFLMSNRFRKLFINLWRYKVVERVDYKQEIFPYQWRIALSWLSGYFIFQLFNPVLFAYSGPKIAGQVGITLTALNGILSLVLSWTSTKVPFWSSLISKQEYDTLDISFNQVIRSSTFVCICCVCLFLLFLMGLSFVYIPLYDRFLPITLVIILSTTIIINNMVNAWATYLRCHKKEPFLIQAVIIGVLTALSTYLSGKYIGVDGVVIGYTLITVLVSFPLSFCIFTTKKKEYHGI